jgi:hypothetical protein
MKWMRMAMSDATRDLDILYPSKSDDASVVYVAQDDGWTMWVYAVKRYGRTYQWPSHGGKYAYWIRRDQDKMEWFGDGDLISSAQASAEIKLVSVRAH